MTREEEIRARLGNATHGPWKVFEQVHEDDKPYLAERSIGTAWDHPQLKGPAHVVTMSYCMYEPHHRVYISESDAELIAHAPSDIEYLLKENQRLRGALEQVKSVFDDSEISDMDYALESYKIVCEALEGETK